MLCGSARFTLRACNASLATCGFANCKQPVLKFLKVLVPLECPKHAGLAQFPEECRVCRQDLDDLSISIKINKRILWIRNLGYAYTHI
jgi:hypothetical protein